MKKTMSITLYGINNCDTIKRSKTWLKDQGIEFAFYDYKKAGCPAELARRLVKQFPLEKLINRRGTTWRTLSEAERNALDEGSAASLMSQYPSLIKRPILQTHENWLIGFDETIWSNALIGQA